MSEQSPANEVVVREGLDSDSEGLIALIASIFAEYPGCVLDVEERARALGRTRVELWTDTRFIDAHRLYERLCYERGPETRALHDLSRTIEYFYRKLLTSSAY